MKRSDPPAPLPEPVRLIHEASPVADLLRQERNRALSPPVPFGQMMARVRPRRARSALLFAAAFAMPLGAWFVARMPPNEPAVIAAELATVASSVVVAEPPQMRRKVVQDARSNAVALAGQGEPSAKDRRQLRANDELGTEPSVGSAVSSGAAQRPDIASHSTKASTRLGPIRSLDARRTDGGGVTAHHASSPGSLHADEATQMPDSRGEDCSALSRRGAFQEAVTCFDEKAKGQGVGAELALLEGARIAWKALHSSEVALERLRRYETRFEDGALLREAILLKLEVLQSAGQLSAARELIEKAIVLVPERGNELRKQAFDLKVRQGACDLARRDAEALVEAGVLEALVASTLAECERRAADVSANVAGARPVR